MLKKQLALTALGLQSTLYPLGSLLPTNLSELFQLFCLVFFQKHEGMERYFLLQFGSGRQSTGLGSSP
jgi:hypothetical protein